jgi:hypothetical protein
MSDRGSYCTIVHLQGQSAVLISILQKLKCHFCCCVYLYSSMCCKWALKFEWCLAGWLGILGFKIGSCCRHWRPAHHLVAWNKTVQRTSWRLSHSALTSTSYTKLHYLPINTSCEWYFSELAFRITITIDDRTNYAVSLIACYCWERHSAEQDHCQTLSMLCM